LVALPLWKIGACAETSEACRPTVRGAGGPFYREGAPWRSKLCDASEPGEPLVVSGRVTAADSCQPLKGAVVDVFQANAAGLYDTQIKGLDPARFHLRGQMRTDEAGRYRFETVLPGNYTDGIERARHIHFRVSAPGYAPLVTECYFEGEPRNATDRLVKAPLVIRLSDFTHERERRKYHAGTFDLVLARA
jgi:catechol 1,2-dioxygenase